MEILQIPINKINSESLTPAHAEFIESVNNCPLCGKELHFTHQLKYNIQKIYEEAYCKNCGIRTKAQDFLLH